MTTGLLGRLSLRRDQQEPELIDAAMRTGASAVGTNLWVLFFAILIASVGLNTNSTAVVIGAMLISPLMGPIVGLGYGAAVADLALIRSAARNLAVFTALSLLTSALYFALSPLDEAHSELLARTSPTLWDVLIATFGGAAGMVAATRRNFSNVVPGVAIATALMPPLCTAGFGLAHARWDMFAGASYLFLINGVFIAASTLAVAIALRLPARGQIDPSTRTRARFVLAIGLALVLVPSVALGIRFVNQEVFASAAQAVAADLRREARVIAYDVDPRTRSLELITAGGRDHPELRERTLALLAERGVRNAKVDVRRAGDDPVDVSKLRRDLARDLSRDVQGLGQSLAGQLRQTEDKLRAIEEGLAEEQRVRAEAQREATRLNDEIRTQLPAVLLASLAVPPATPAAGAGSAVVVLTVARPLRAQERARLEQWLSVRLARADVSVVEQVARSARRA